MLTSTQITALGNDIAANTNTVSFEGASVQIKDLPNTIETDIAIVAWYNQEASPAWVVWKTRLDPDDYIPAMDWGEVDAIIAAKARIFEWLTSGLTRPFNPALANVRAGMTQAFTVAATPNTRAALLALAKKNATRAQKLFSTGTGTDATPATLAAGIHQSFTLSVVDVRQARGG